MSYLRFDKNQMTNLEETLPREILRTNRSGAYHCSSIIGCNTRKYHGLLVMPIPEIDDENHVMLSSLDATVIQHGAEFELSTHRYSGDIYDPRGYKYIREFECDKVPTTIYRVGGVVLRREIVFAHHENRVMIRYTLVDAHSKTTMRLRPFLAFRSVRQHTHENSGASRDYTEVDGGIRTCMYKGYPDLYMQLSTDNQFHFTPDWYRNIEYKVEHDRGYDFNEDLYVPGYFEFDIQKGQSVVFSASDQRVDTSGLEDLFSYEVDDRTPRTDMQHCLINAAHQFLNKQGDESYILAGYPWFKCRARDMFISLPGLTLPAEEYDKFDRVMLTAEKAIMDFIRGADSRVQIYEMSHPDVLMWAVWTIQQYAKIVSMEECARKYAGLVTDIVDYLTNNRHPNLRVDDNGLVWSEGRDKAITWMNSESNGTPVVPRTGYIVEFNALWYNMLRFAVELTEETGSKAPARWRELADKCERTFPSKFISPDHYLFDYVDGGNQDKSVRPNMIFAAAFEYSPLTLRERKMVVDIVTRELLTPKGLRSLSPKSGGYKPVYLGPQSERDLAYHNGTAWPWLLGFYFQAYFKVYKMSSLGFIRRHLIGMDDEMQQGCIACLSELYDGNPPFKGRGAVSFAMNVAEILRSLYFLTKYNL